MRCMKNMKTQKSIETLSNGTKNLEAGFGQRSKKLGVASISLGSPNFGDYIIEYAVSQLLGNLNPFVTFPSHSKEIPSEVKDVDLIFCPGATCLDLGYLPSRLLEVPIPILPFAACVWEPTRIQTRVDVVMRGLEKFFPMLKRYRLYKQYSTIDLGILNKSIQPIGCRDSWTYEVLKKMGYNAEYVGCPVMYLNDGNDIPPLDYIAVSLPRKNANVFLKKVKMEFPKCEIKVLIHELYEYKIASQFPEITVVNHKEDGRYMLDFYKYASCVITGRVHGCLPAVAYNKPVLYVSDLPNDSRHTLLRDIGVNIFPTDSWDPSNLQVIDKSKYSDLEGKMKKYVGQVKEKLFS